MDRMSAALMGLLHDIGKFWQRTASQPGVQLGPGYENLSPAAYGETGAHATWSAAYIKRYLAEDQQQDTDAVLYHHRPQKADAMLLALADQLASGEQADIGGQEPERLQSIFTRIGQKNDAAYLPLQQLAPARDVIFPLDQDDPKPAAEAYRALWQEFTLQSESLRELSDSEALVTALYDLMAQFTWSVPAAFYRGVSDVSLFDHSRMTAAIAACLVDQDPETIRSCLETIAHGNPDNKTPVAVLVEGDLSGVQRFLYTITARGATSALRGRSFYLQLLTEATARFILRRHQLSIANLIYVGGGHFYMLAPPSILDDLHEIQSFFDRFFLDRHDGDLYLALGGTPLTCKDFQLEHFAPTWRQSGAAVATSKLRRFATVGHELFDPRGIGGDATKDCQVCHYEGDDVTEVPREEEDPEPVRKCALCRSLEELGRDLRDVSQILVTEVAAATQPARDWHSTMRMLGLDVLLREEDRNWSMLPADPIRARLLGIRALPDVAEATALSRSLHCPVVRGQRLIVNVAPKRSGNRLATFSDLQKASHGLKRLGVLRMDVDDLGQLFGRGFVHTDNRGRTFSLATLSRVASLSSALVRYFEGWVGSICQQVNEQSEVDTVYSIYSGGDDLFIVGSWHQMPLVAQRISQDFADYVSHDRSIHLSGALTLHGGKEPLYMAADAAGNALDVAKDLPGKNAFNFFGRNLTWREFEQVESVRDDLLELVNLMDGNRSHLRTLYDAFQQYEREQQRYSVLAHSRKPTTSPSSATTSIVWGPYMWRTLYLLYRMSDRYKPAAQALQKLIDSLQENHFSNIKQVGLAAAWTEAYTRKSSEQRMD